MSGIVAWLLRDGPTNRDVPKIQTFIFRGIVYHFGRAVPWYVGPVRVPRTYDPERFSQYELSDSDFDTGTHPAFAAEDDRLSAVTETDEHLHRRKLFRAAMRRAKLDPSARKIVSLRLGFCGRCLSFGEIGARLNLSRQTAHNRFTAAVDAIVNVLRESGSC